MESYYNILQGTTERLRNFVIINGINIYYYNHNNFTIAHDQYLMLFALKLAPYSLRSEPLASTECMKL